MRRSELLLASMGCMISCFLFVGTFAQHACGQASAAHPSRSDRFDAPFLDSRSSLIARVWTTRSGLPQNTVNGIAQTPDGFLWIATYGGLVRFDGSRFKTYDIENTPEFRSNRISALCCDREGRLWIGAGHLVRYEKGKFAVAPPESSTKSSIKGIAEDANGVIWIVGRRIIRHEAGVFTRVIPEDFRGPFRRAISVDGEVWVASWREALPRLVSQEGASNLNHQEIARLISAGSGSPVIPELDAESEALMRKRPGLIIEALCRDRRGRLWIGTPEGVFVAEPRPTGKGSVGIRYRRLLESPTATEVLCFFVDRSGDVWIGTNGRGLVQICEEPFEVFGPDNGLSDSSNQTLAPGPSGSWFVTHPLGAGNIWSIRNGELSRYARGKLDGKCLLESRDGWLWATGKRRLAKFRGEETQYIDLDTWPRSLLEAEDGSIWCGGNGALYRIKDEVVERFGADAGVPSGSILTLTEGVSGAVWFGGRFGMARFEDGKATTFNEDAPVRSVVRTSFRDRDGGIWFGSYGGGLTRIHKGSIVHVTTLHGLPDNAICKIQRDRQGKVWFNCNRGVFYVPESELIAFANGASELIQARLFPTPEGSGNSGGLSSEGIVGFPSLQGLVFVNPDEIAPPRRPLPAVIALTTSSARFENEAQAKPPLDERDLAFSFKSPSFNDPLSYRYRLVGFDDDWHETLWNDEVVFRRLKPGSYRFEVVSVNSIGVESERPSVMNIEVPANYHETLWFRGLAAALSLILLMTFYFHRVHTRSIQRAAIEAEVKERRSAEELARASEQRALALGKRVVNAQDEERRRIARELHDDHSQRLAAIAIDLATIRDSIPVDDDSTAETVDRATNQIRSVADDVHSLSRHLHPSSLSDLGLVNTVRTECAGLEKRSGISVVFEADSDLNEMPEAITLGAFRIAHESLQNIQKHSCALKVQVSFKKCEDVLEFTIEDDGKGFDVADAEHGGTLGLSSMRERAETLGGTFTLASLPGEGTRIDVRLPISPGKSAS